MTCVKKRYKRKKWAKNAVKNWRARGGDGDLEAYRCEFCNYYHLGHPTAYDMLRKRQLATSIKTHA